MSTDGVACDVFTDQEDDAGSVVNDESNSAADSDDIQMVNATGEHHDENDDDDDDDEDDDDSITEEEEARYMTLLQLAKWVLLSCYITEKSVNQWSCLREELVPCCRFQLLKWTWN